MNKQIKNILICSVSLILIFLVFNSLIFAHSGNTDSNGGHFDNSTGKYHYHHGYPAHQHIDGECPYDFEDKNNVNSTELKSNDYYNDPNTVFYIVTVVIVFFDLIIFTIFFKKELLDSNKLLVIIIEYFKYFILFYLLFLMCSIPTVIIWAIIENSFKIDINSNDFIMFSPFYTILIFFIAMSISKLLKLIIKKNKLKKIKQQTDLANEQNINDSFDVSKISTQISLGDNMNSIYISNFINKERDTINISAFVAKLFISAFNPKFTIDNCFVRELLYFSQLYIINSFKNLKSVEINENDFLITSRYSVGNSLSIYPRRLICDKQEESNIKNIIRNNYFTNYDIELLYKMLYVAYKRGYASLNKMIEIFEETEQNEFIWFKKSCETYFENLTNEVTFIREKEIERIELFNQHSHIFNNENITYSLKEIERLFII